MENEVKVMRFKELKEVVASLENDPAVTDDTKVFLNTGWDSIQEIEPGAISTEKAKIFWVEDPLTKERFPGYSLEENTGKLAETGDAETVIVIKNLY